MSVPCCQNCFHRSLIFGGGLACSVWKDRVEENYHCETYKPSCELVQESEADSTFCKSPGELQPEAVSAIGPDKQPIPQSRLARCLHVVIQTVRYQIHHMIYAVKQSTNQEK